MADVYTPQAVKTRNPGDVVVKVADSATPTQQLAIDASGRVTVNLAAGATIGLAAGSASIGTVGLNAGSNLVGKVGIDQTTPGTTNAVQVTGPGTSSGNPLFVSTSAGAAGTVYSTGKLTTASVPSGSSTTLSTPAVTSGKIGSLLHVTATADVPLKVVIQTVNSSSVATDEVVLFTSAQGIADWKPFVSNEIQTVSADGTNVKLQVVITNMDNTTASDVYAFLSWSEA